VASKFPEERTPIYDVTDEDRGDRRGVFVSLHIDDDLRGCIGVMTSDRPLVETIVAMAVGAGFEDPRFPPLTVEELDRVRFEISLIGPAVEIAGVDGIVAGRDGIVVTVGPRRALLLPQVASQVGGSMEDFLDAACRKAGLSAGAWKSPDARIQTFTAEVFSEL